MSRPQVAIIQQFLTHYRLPFLYRLQELCAQGGVDLVCYYGADPSRHLLEAPPECATPVTVALFKNMTWQPVWKKTSGADLVIVEQAVKHLINYPLMARRIYSNQKLAFWGHGKNFQARNPNSVSECVKAFMSRHVDWWFAYNDLSARVVRNLGFPPDRITSLQNTVDTVGLRASIDSLPAAALSQIKADMGIDSKSVAVYTGGLYSDKRIPFMLEASNLIRSSVPDFHLIVIGKGPDEEIVRQASAQHAWIHYVGPKNDADKIPYWAISKIFLMPGLVGLAIVDSFALGVPMVTTAYPYHSPEIDYLKNGVNGIMVEDWKDPAAYAKAVIDLLRDEPRRQKIIEAGKADAEIYTIENMAANFFNGLVRAISV
jgi:glycosyltransferase involved in cell wall biosynthesis